MTDMEIYRPRAALAVPAASDIDSWTEVLADVADLASKIAGTPFVPDGLRGSVPAVAAAILSGRELGLGPMTSLANIHVIKGKPALSAALMRALILAQGHQLETVDISDTRAVVRGRRRGEAEWETAAFTADQARQAKIDLGGYPQDKLYARATSRLARRKFADVIAGMPYSAEELEDGTTIGDVPGADVILPGESYKPLKDAEQPRPRTARRRQAATDASPAPAASSAAPASPPPSQGAGEALPPLPGEDDEPKPEATGDPDANPGSVTTKQITAIWTILTKEFGFGSAEADKDQARLVCAHIVDHDLSTTTMLSKREAGTILDTLGHWQYQAEQEKQDPRDYMMALLVAQDGADGE